MHAWWSVTLQFRTGGWIVGGALVTESCMRIVKPT